MVLKLYASPKSTCSRRVAAVLHEKQVPFELIPIDRTAGENRSEEYLKKNPFGQVPCIDDDGFILYESRAIGRYIATKYANQGTKLIPTGLEEVALFEQAASNELCNFDPHAGPLYFETAWKPEIGLTPNKEVVEEKIKRLSAKLEVYDAILGKQKYLAGDEFTLADLYHLPIGLGVFQGGVNIINDRANVARWWKDISSRPAWLAVEKEITSTA
ncbi:hypothetical protein H0H93_011765 [Arthromyces matolae]|nr:hypothetical protein H0H93_011765 [Arthromyces matolae]